MKKFTYILIPALAVSTIVHGVTINFDTANDFSSNFAGAGTFSQSLTGGIGGSGSVTLSNTSSTAVYQTPISSLSGASVSIFFQHNGVSNTGRGAHVGFTSDATDTYANSGNISGTDIMVTIDGNATTGNLFGLGIHNNGAQVTTTPKDNLFTNGSWYRLELTVASVSGGDLLGVTGNLYSESGTLLDTIDGGTMTNGLAGDTSIFAAFGGQNPTSRGYGAVDNFTVVPEPSVYATFAGLLAFGLAVWRRKRAS